MSTSRGSTPSPPSESGSSVKESTKYLLISALPVAGSRTTSHVWNASMWSVMLFGAGGSQTLAFQFTTTLTSARPPSPSIVASTLLIVCTSSKNRRVTFSYQTVNSAWPCVGSSGHSMSFPWSVIIACRSATGAWTSSALYQRSARSWISSVVSAAPTATSLTAISSFVSRSRMRPRAGDRPAVRRVLLVSGHLLVEHQVDQVRAVLLQRLGDRGRDLVGCLDARGRDAHAARELVEAELRVAE